jgi:hypothetical protein
MSAHRCPVKVLFSTIREMAPTSLEPHLTKRRLPSDEPFWKMNSSLPPDCTTSESRTSQTMVKSFPSYAVAAVGEKEQEVGESENDVAEENV